MQNNRGSIEEGEGFYQERKERLSGDKLTSTKKGDTSSLQVTSNFLISHSSLLPLPLLTSNEKASPLTMLFLCLIIMTKGPHRWMTEPLLER